MGLNFSAYNTDEIIDFLQEQVKDGIVKTDKDSLQTASYSQNLPGQHGLALALVEAGSIADVQGVMRLPAASTCQLFPRTASPAPLLALMLLTTPSFFQPPR